MTVDDHWTSVRKRNFILKRGMKVSGKEHLKAVCKMGCAVSFLIAGNEALNATIVVLCHFQCNGSAIGVRSRERFFARKS